MAEYGFLQKELAELVGYTPQRLIQINAELDEDRKLFVKREDGKYDLKAFVTAWLDYKTDQIQEEAFGGNLDAIKAQHEAVKKRKTELEVAEMEKSLVEADIVKRAFQEVAHNTQKRLMQIPKAVSARLIKRDDPAEIAEILEDEIRSALTQLGKTPVTGEAVDE